MRRLLILVTAVATCALAAGGVASAGVTQTHDSTRHEVLTVHDVNICGDLSTVTFDINSQTHVVEKANGTFAYEFSQHYTYTEVFDDPALGTWTGHATETVVHISNGGSDQVVHDNLVDMEGPVQIIFHEQIRFDGFDVTVDRQFLRVAGC